ncbi:MAG: PKD domain-containing protein, partial [Bacteroidota bacterium]|nr:PKD domain-containing protein [Bacteroidota bacterium]
ISDGSQNAFSYLWNFGDGSTSSIKSPSHNYSSIGPFSVSLSVTSNAGCTDNSTKSVATIYQQPTAKFNVPAEVCYGTSVNYTDQSLASGSTISQWQWDFGDGSLPSTQQNPTHNYASPGTYTVSLIVTSAVGCVSIATTKSLVVNALPMADFISSAPSCVTKTISFTNTSSSNSGAIIKWSWNYGDGGTSSQTSPTHVFASTGTYNVTLQVETDKGCIGIVTSKPVVINPLPVPGFIMPGNCINDPITQFIDTSTIADGSQGLFSYQWNFGDQNANAGNPNTSVTKNAMHKYTATGNYNVAFTVTSNNGCSSTITQVFTINGAVPQSSFSVQGGLQQCSNDSVRILDNSTVFPGRLVKLEIYWDYAGDPLNKLVINNPAAGALYSYKYPEFFAPATKDYIVKVVSYSGINCLSSSQKTVTMLATPNIVFDTITPVCADKNSLQVLANVSNMTGGSGIFSGTGISGGGLFNPQIGSGTYIIRYTYTATNTCSNYKEQKIIVFPVPIVSAGPDKFVLEGGTAVLNGSSSGNGVSYLWMPATYLNNPIIAKPVTTPADDITYTLTVTSADGCIASDDVFVKVLKSPTIPNVFTPNGDGVNDTWIIPYLESYPGATVEIFNRYGSLVYHSVGYPKPWDGTFGGKQMPAGTYYYIINPKNGRKQISGFVDIVR